MCERVCTSHTKLVRPESGHLSIPSVHLPPPPAYPFAGVGSVPNPVTASSVSRGATRYSGPTCDHRNAEARYSGRVPLGAVYSGLTQALWLGIHGSESREIYDTHQWRAPCRGIVIYERVKGLSIFSLTGFDVLLSTLSKE